MPTSSRNSRRVIKSSPPAGMYGTVKRIDEGIVVIEIAKGVNIKVARRAIAEVIRDKQMARCGRAGRHGTTR